MLVNITGRQQAFMINNKATGKALVFRIPIWNIVD